MVGSGLKEQFVLRRISIKSVLFTALYLSGSVVSISTAFANCFVVCPSPRARRCLLRCSKIGTRRTEMSQRLLHRKRSHLFPNPPLFPPSRHWNNHIHNSNNAVNHDENNTLTTFMRIHLWRRKEQIQGTVQCTPEIVPIFAHSLLRSFSTSSQ